MKYTFWEVKKWPEPIISTVENKQINEIQNQCSEYKKLQMNSLGQGTIHSRNQG